MKVLKYDSMLDKSGAIYLRESGTFNIDGRRSYSSPDALAEFFGDVIGIKQAAETADRLYKAGMITIEDALSQIALAIRLERLNRE